MGQGALSKPVVQWWLSLNSSTRLECVALSLDTTVVELQAVSNRIDVLVAAIPAAPPIQTQGTATPAAPPHGGAQSGCSHGQSGHMVTVITGDKENDDVPRRSWSWCSSTTQRPGDRPPPADLPAWHPWGRTAPPVQTKRQVGPDFCYKIIL